MEQTGIDFGQYALSLRQIALRNNTFVLMDINKINMLRPGTAFAQICKDCREIGREFNALSVITSKKGGM